MFELIVETDNAAFEGDHRNHELARILRAVARRLEEADRDVYEGRVLDLHGNKVGRWRIPKE